MKEEIKKNIGLLQNAKRLLGFVNDNPKASTYNKALAEMCDDLSEFCSRQDNVQIKKMSNEFKGLNKLYRTLYGRDKATKSYVRVFYDVRETRVEKQDKNCVSIAYVVNHKDKKYKTEPCKITHRLDGVVEIDLEGLTIEVPKKYWREYEEQEKGT